MNSPPGGRPQVSEIIISVFISMEFSYPFGLLAASLWEALTFVSSPCRQFRDGIVHLETLRQGCVHRIEFLVQCFPPTPALQGQVVHRQDLGASGYKCITFVR